MDGDVLEVDCSRSIDVVRSRKELERQVVGTVRRKVVGPNVCQGGVTEIDGVRRRIFRTIGDRVVYRK
ncbi:hypothetical protein A2U01_0092120, partial [Trifolium medium]|nr:hypothetical protein [Trifolium medium]